MPHRCHTDATQQGDTWPRGARCTDKAPLPPPNIRGRIPHNVWLRAQPPSSVLCGVEKERFKRRGDMFPKQSTAPPTTPNLSRLRREETVKRTAASARHQCFHKRPVVRGSPPAPVPGAAARSPASLPWPGPAWLWTATPMAAEFPEPTSASLGHFCSSRWEAAVAPQRLPAGPGADGAVGFASPPTPGGHISPHPWWRLLAFLEN